MSLSFFVETFFFSRVSHLHLPTRTFVGRHSRVKDKRLPRFFLCHYDDPTGDFLVDDDFNHVFVDVGVTVVENLSELFHLCAQRAN
jgi:hypothetical protein